jgi:hypothetical protein
MGTPRARHEDVNMDDLSYDDVAEDVEQTATAAVFKSSDFKSEVGPRTITIERTRAGPSRSYVHVPPSAWPAQFAADLREGVFGYPSASS